MCERQQHQRPKRARDNGFLPCQDANSCLACPKMAKQPSKVCGKKCNQPRAGPNRRGSEDLDPIEEEQWPNIPDDGGNSCNMPQRSPCAQCLKEEDPCSEFFEVMRTTMYEAVKKSTEEIFEKYFPTCFQKIEDVRAQLERNECVLSKIYKDLNDKISYYGERNAQQFQYLCVRMEQDRIFYQQQQEYMMKARCKAEEEENAKEVEKLCKNADCLKTVPELSTAYQGGEQPARDSVLDEDVGYTLKESKQTTAINKKAETGKKPAGKK